MLECVVNVSEGRLASVIDAVGAAAGRALLDVHSDADHNRSVLTLAGDEVEAAARAVAARAVSLIDLRRHTGAHPRVGAVDVVPFAPLTGSTMDDAVAARDRFASWMRDELAVPCLVYGPGGPSLPDLRRLVQDASQVVGHPTAGVCCAGARPVLVAYNVWLADGAGAEEARAIAAALRGPAVRALGLHLGGHSQVSFNLIEPSAFGPDAAFDAVATRSAVARGELVGLVPASVLEAISPDRWELLDLGPSRTIEARLKETGLDGGSFRDGPGGS